MGRRPTGPRPSPIWPASWRKPGRAGRGAGRAQPARRQSTGSVGVVRGDTATSATVSTVDDVDTDTGRIATVLGLVEQNGGGVGRYGFAADAQAQVPTLAVG